ncbi:hypothetical protein GUITHDRAFT_105967 [Guillardia theta CCMP2712]|uniref:Zn(2)-C6 fungal-type domain-containing protein n=1 Tax=Guillardia theta (strain CCMP2712) TaxID=905079 RepID=L1JJN6_GUITC|nr:hypothetical protein GUITHDRAFT_105967 [Guillardia theta CCMP2712]EKX48359.1 hypothetical protein GUITHDRAFT_105967 [Guillardia theta CCMP2712]|eukprot:XP_005835339.1 hypothetical protein GUITHDRAFT_105967 [Guillardia theta CCMP2712]
MDFLQQPGEAPQKQRACLRCKEARVKCDRERPCSRCRRQDMVDKCLYEESQLALVRSLGPVEPLSSKSPFSSKRSKCSKACSVCQKSKAKCEADRPCRRCILQGCGDQCYQVGWRESLVQAPADEQCALQEYQESLGKEEAKGLNVGRRPSSREAGGEYMVQLYDGESSPDDDFFNMEQLFYCPDPVMNYWISNVDRPLSYLQRYACISQATFPTFDQATRSSWFFGIVRMYWENGTNITRLKNMLASIPTYLQEELMTGFAAVQDINIQRMKVLVCLDPADLPTRSLQSLKAVKTSPDHLNSNPCMDEEFDRFLMETWDNDTEQGTLCHTYCPETGRLQKVFVSKTLAEIVGSHVEEVLCRLWNREANLALSDWDWLCMMVDDSVRVRSSGRSEQAVTWQQAKETTITRYSCWYIHRKQRTVK